MMDWSAGVERYVILATGVVTLLSSLAAFVQGLRNQGRIAELHVTMNSRLDQLLATTRSDAHAAGVVQGRLEGDLDRSRE